MVHAVIVTIKLRDAAAVKTFLAAFKPLLEHSNTEEPNTLTYELHLSEDDATTLLVLERYVEKSDLEKHMQSEVFKTFFGWVGAHSPDAADENARLIEKFDIKQFGDAATKAGFAAL